MPSLPISLNATTQPADVLDTSFGRLSAKAIRLMTGKRTLKIVAADSDGVLSFRFLQNFGDGVWRAYTEEMSAFSWRRALARI